MQGDPVRWPKLNRLVLAGLAAGLIFNLGGLSAAAIIGMRETFARYGIEPSAAAGLLHLGLRFGLGFTAAWLLAMTGRAGTPREWLAALAIGLSVWFCAYVPGSFVLFELGVFSGRSLGFSLFWGCAESLLAAVVAVCLLRPKP